MSASKSTARNKHSRHSASSIDITKEEFSRIEEALKKEEFRKLFLDYCEEIQDPENRKLYEEEIKQLEAERGIECRFVNPEPGFVIKTSVDGLLKCFINIAKSPEVAKPTSEVSINHENGERGINWSIPMAQAPPRDDLDTKNIRCCVYDVVFHPDALYLAQKNPEFRKCLIDTALDAVEREYKVNLDRANLKFPKLDYKGVARPTVIRKLAKNPPPEANEPHPLDNIYPARPTAESGIPKQLPIKTKVPPKPEYATPKYVVKHRRGIDLTEYTEELDAKLNVTVPRELVVEIELPLLSSAAECQLDVTEKSVYLLSDRAGAKYRLKLDLPYAVNDKDGAARFDTDTRRLSITLPVQQPSVESQRKMHSAVLHLNREDSGVESDVRDESSTDHSPSESPIQEVEQNFTGDEGDNDDDDDGDNEEAVGVKDGDVKDENENTKSLSCLVETSENFLKTNLPYKFPEKFDCNVLDNVISLVLHVRNVQSESIATLRPTQQSVHLRFTSLGTGYYPNHYAFYVQLPADGGSNLEIVSTDAEAWENNIVLNLHLNGSGELLRTYAAGLDSNDAKNYTVQHHQFKTLNGKSESCKSTYGIPSGPLESDLNILVERKKLENIIEIEITPREIHSSTGGANTTEDEDTPTPATNANGDADSSGATDTQASQQKKLNRRQRKRNKKQRSLSESAFDDIKSAIKQLEESKDQSNQSMQLNSSGEVVDIIGGGGGNAQQQRKQRSMSECRDNIGRSLPFKGILKRYSRYGSHQPTMMRSSTSDSCSSSVEDCSVFSNSINNGTSLSSLQFSKSFSDIPEEHVSSSLSESCKKTVRFSDTIQKQIFRLDSSILGQRKKNQKRRDRKQRAIQRRLSEGDSADYEEDHKPITIQRGTRSSMPMANNNNKDHADASNDIKFNGNNGGNGSNDTDGSRSVISRVKSAKGKKKRRNMSNRSSRESESSDADATNKASMMFEIDLE